MYRGLEGSSVKIHLNSIFEYSYFSNKKMVHKMVHAVTAYPSICLKLRVFVLKFDNPCRKSIRVSSTEIVWPTKSIRVLSTGRQQS